MLAQSSRGVGHRSSRGFNSWIWALLTALLRHLLQEAFQRERYRIIDKHEEKKTADIADIPSVLEERQ